MGEKVLRHMDTPTAPAFSSSVLIYLVLPLCVTLGTLFHSVYISIVSKTMATPAVAIGSAVCAYVINQGVKYAVCKTIKVVSSDKENGKRRARKVKIAWAISSMAFGNVSDALDLLPEAEEIASKVVVCAGGAAASIAEDATEELYNWKPEEITMVGDGIKEKFHMDGEKALTFQNLGDRGYHFITS